MLRDSSEEGWSRVRQTDGIDVYRRYDAADPTKLHFRIDADFDADIFGLLAVLKEVDLKITVNT